MKERKLLGVATAFALFGATACSPTPKDQSGGFMIDCSKGDYGQFGDREYIVEWDRDFTIRIVDLNVIVRFTNDTPSLTILDPQGKTVAEGISSATLRKGNEVYKLAAVHRGIKIEPGCSNKTNPPQLGLRS